MWRTNTLCTLADEDLGTLAEYDPLTSFGDILVECVDGYNNEVSEQADWRVWAGSGDNDNDNSPVTSGSLSPDMGGEWKNWCVEDPDWEVMCSR